MRIPVFKFSRGISVPAYPSIHDLLAGGKPDGIVICTPTTLHIEQGLQCIAAGIPALIEKPIGTSYLASLALVDEAKQKKVPVVVDHHRRHNPLIHAARRCIESGRLGAIRAVHSQCWFYEYRRYKPPTTTKQPHTMQALTSILNTRLSLFAQHSPLPLHALRSGSSGSSASTSALAGSTWRALSGVTLSRCRLFGATTL